MLNWPRLINGRRQMYSKVLDKSPTLQFIDPLYSEPAWHIPVLRANVTKLFAWEFLVSNRLYLEATSTSANAMSNKSGLVAMSGHIDMIHKLQSFN